MRRLIFLLVLLVAASATAQINETEVWVGDLAIKDGMLNVTHLKNVSESHPGYDNQPLFFPNGNTLVFSSQVMEVDDTGMGVQAKLVDLPSGKITPLPDAKGFSPTPTPDGMQLMVLRRGRVFLHDLTGKELRALTDTDTVGYYTPFDDHTWAMFMNDKDRRIVIYDPATKKMDTMATGAMTAPYRVPNQRAVTFVATEGDKRVLRKLDLKKRRVETLATIDFPTGGHHVWTSRGTLLMASGSAIYEWNPAKPTEWTQVFSSFHPDLMSITRIALSPKGDRIALVSVPSDETIIRNTRAESNRWIALHRPDRVACLFKGDGTVTTAMGRHLQGREAIEVSLAEQFKNRPDIVYVRTPEAIELSRSDPSAFERGTWTGRWNTPVGYVDLSGQYAAVWRRDVSSAGARTWMLQSEVFVPLRCEGRACDER